MGDDFVFTEYQAERMDVCALATEVSAGCNPSPNNTLNMSSPPPYLAFSTPFFQSKCAKQAFILSGLSNNKYNIN